MLMTFWNNFTLKILSLFSAFYIPYLTLPYFTLLYLTLGIERLILRYKVKIRLNFMKKFGIQNVVTYVRKSP